MVTHFYAEYLIQKVLNTPTVLYDANTWREIKEDLAAYEHMATIHDIFLDTLMNTKQTISEFNIDNIELFIKYWLNKFQTWKNIHRL